MRAVLTMLALAASAAVSAAPPADPYTASGADWSLTIGDRITFTSPGTTVTDKAPQRKASDMGSSYVTPKLAVEVIPGGCDDEKSGRRYADVVFVWVGKHTYSGCGGRLLAADSLEGTSWAIVNVAGAELWHPNLAIDFVGDQFLAYTGCNRVGGTWAREGDVLTISPTGSTTGRCAQPRAGCERRIWQILAEPVKIEFADPKTLVLSSGKGSLRLRNPGKDENLFESRLQPCPQLAE